MARTNRSNDIRTARRLKEKLNAKAAAEFEALIAEVSLRERRAHAAEAYVANRALSQR